MASFPRLPSGRVDWQAPSTRRRLISALREGVTLRDLAARVGVTLRSLQRALIRLDLDLPPAGEVFLSELAGELGLSLPGTHALLRRAGIPMLAWGGRRTVRRCDVAHLPARPPVVRVAPPELCTAAQMAERTRMDPATLRARLSRAGVRPRALLVKNKGRAYLYDPRDIQAALFPPGSPCRCPAGHLTTAEVAKLTGVSQKGVHRWYQKGAPAVRAFGESGRLYWPALRLAAWLENCPQERTQRKASYLRDWAARQPQQQGRAA